MFLRSAIASRVKRPCLSAFLLPLGAPDPRAPPCMRQRLLPQTDGDLQELPERVLAPQRLLLSMGPMLRLCVPAICLICASVRCPAVAWLSQRLAWE
jgi:hypothetical protein